MSEPTGQLRLMDDHACLTVAPGDATDSPAWSLLAAGDFRIAPRPGHDRTIDHSLVGPDLAKRIHAAEIAILNLEGPLCNDGKPIPKCGAALRVDPDAAKLLKATGFNAVSLANNHITDFGRTGLDQTLERCRAAGLAVCGAGANRAAAQLPVELDVAGGVCVSLLAFCEREFGIADEQHPGAAWISHPATRTAVRAAAERSDVVIVMAHGGVELESLPPPARQAQLRELVDAGATVVIGHHPHVAQGWERHGDGIIFYSLGNFLFDFEESEPYPDTDWALAVVCHFQGARLTRCELIPTRPAHGVVETFNDTKEAKRRLEHLRDLSAVIRNTDQLQDRWRKRALELFEREYLGYLRAGCGLPSGNGQPAATPGLIRRLLRRSSKKAADGPRPAKPHLLLNLVRNESHSAVIQTALTALAEEEQTRS